MTRWLNFKRDWKFFVLGLLFLVFIVVALLVQSNVGKSKSVQDDDQVVTVPKSKTPDQTIYVLKRLEFTKPIN